MMMTELSFFSPTLSCGLLYSDFIPQQGFMSDGKDGQSPSPGELE